MLYWLTDKQLSSYEPGSSEKSRGYRGVSSDSFRRASLAEDIMSSPVKTVEVSQTLSDALSQMESLGVGHLAVMENGQFAGLLSDRDILQAFDGDDFVGRHMSTQLLLAGPKDPIRKIAQTMVHHHIHCVPVLDDQSFLVGVLTTTDILGCMTYQSSLDVWF